jgi:hypothetical protein
LIRIDALRHRPVRNAHRKEGVGERDVVDSVLFRIVRELRIDVEHHRHVALLARLQGLLGEAEAVDLLKIGPGCRRRDIVVGLPGRDACRLVTHSIVDGDDFAEPHVDCSAFGLEGPRQPGRNVGIETYGNGAARNFFRRRLRHLGGAAKSRSAAEPGIKRHCSEGNADHDGDKGTAGESDEQVTTPMPRSDHSGRSSTPGPLTSVTM